MKISFKSGEVMPFNSFLNSVKLAGRSNRAKVKFMEKLEEKFAEIQKDFQAHFPQLAEDVSDEVRAERQREESEFLAEDAVIDLSEYEAQVNTLYEALDDYQYELEGQDSVLHAKLTEKLEEAVNKTQEVK